MSRRTRRSFLGAAAGAALAALWAPRALAQAPLVGPSATPVPSPLPVGPGSPYSGYQSEIYINGMGFGNRPPFTTNLTALETAAARVLPAAAEAHLLEQAGGADAARANAEAFEAWRIVPRMFIDREKRPVATTILGTRMPAPVIVGPIGRQALVHREAEGATARGTQVAGLTYVHAADASTPVEGVALAAPLVPRWFAIDWPGTAGPDAALLRRARLAGCTALVLGAPQPGADWAPLRAVRAAWDGPVVLSGVQTADDAREALRRGLDGVLLSDERGRRGAEPVGTLDALPAVVDAVAGRVPVLFGSGVRTGADVYKALALGADAVVLGRPVVHGLALGGAGGVEHVLRTFLAELDITLATAGVASLRELGRDALLRT